MAFQKGNNANPNGARRPRMVSQQVIAALNEATGDGPTRLRQLVEKLFALALAGDLAAIREVFDRAEGKPAQESMVSVKDASLDDMTDDDLIGAIASVKSLIAKGYGTKTGNGSTQTQSKGQSGGVRSIN